MQYLNRSKNRIQGNVGEEIALKALKKQGMKLLSRNYYAGKKEIDLIMRDRDTIVFVEVKARSSEKYGTPAEAITAQKMQNLLCASVSFLHENGYDEYAARFDVMEVDLLTGKTNHIPNAFGTNERF